MISWVHRGISWLTYIENPDALNIPWCTHDVPHMHHDIPHIHHDIPPMYWTSPDVLMIFPNVFMVSPRCSHDIPPPPPMYSWYPRCTKHLDVLHISRCTEHTTEHTLYRVKIATHVQLRNYITFRFLSSSNLQIHRSVRRTLWSQTRWTIKKGRKSVTKLLSVKSFR